MFGLAFLFLLGRYVVLICVNRGLLAGENDRGMRKMKECVNGPKCPSLNRGELTAVSRRDQISYEITNSKG